LMLYSTQPDRRHLGSGVLIPILVPSDNDLLRPVSGGCCRHPHIPVPCLTNADNCFLYPLCV